MAFFQSSWLAGTTGFWGKRWLVLPKHQLGEGCWIQKTQPTAERQAIFLGFIGDYSNAANGRMVFLLKGTLWECHRTDHSQTFWRVSLPVLFRGCGWDQSTNAHVAMHRVWGESAPGRLDALWLLRLRGPAGIGAAVLRVELVGLTRAGTSEANLWCF